MGLANTWDMEVRMQGEHLKRHPSFIRLPYLFFASFSVVERTFGGDSSVCERLESHG